MYVFHADSLKRGKRYIYVCILCPYFLRLMFQNYGAARERCVLKTNLMFYRSRILKNIFKIRYHLTKGWLRSNGRLNSFPYRHGMMFRYFKILYAKHKLISRMFQLYHGNKKRQWRVMSVCSNCTMSPQKLSRAVQNSISFGWQRWLDHFMNTPYQYRVSETIIIKILSNLYNKLNSNLIHNPSGIQ